MVTEWQIRRLLDEHVKNMESSFKSEVTFAKIHFLAGAIAIIKLQNSSDFRFLNKVQQKEDYVIK